MNVFEQVKNFNTVFGLTPIPVKELHARLVRFREILDDEMVECDDILRLMTADASLLDVKVAIADWLGDIIVYCASEMFRQGLPPEAVIDIIMSSQASKLVDGKPLVQNGKVVKGPGYTPPEPALRVMLEGRV